MNNNRLCDMCNLAQKIRKKLKDSGNLKSGSQLRLLQYVRQKKAEEYRKDLSERTLEFSQDLDWFQQSQSRKFRKEIENLLPS